MDVTNLTNAVGTIFTLFVHLRIEVTVIEDDSICTSETRIHVANQPLVDKNDDKDSLDPNTPRS